MLHLAMVRSPFAHATITSIDTSAAKAAPGVIAVLTGADIADEQGARCRAPGRSPRTRRRRPHPAMAVDTRQLRRRDRRRASWRGRAAEARDAAELVDVDYDELPPVLDMAAAAEDGAT